MRSVVRISRSALQHNLAAFRRVLPQKTACMAVVKSNAYGHGVGECVPILARAGVRWFGTAGVAEAYAVQRLAPRANVLALSYLDGTPKDLLRAIRQGIRLPVYTEAMLRQLDSLARTARRKVKVHMKLDTGTTRVGFLPKEVPAVIRLLHKLPNVHVEGVYSHFAEVESRNQRFSQRQHELFTVLAGRFEQACKATLVKHMDCSAGVLVHPDAHLNMVRVGMSLYGIWTVADPRRVRTRYTTFSLRPVLTWETNFVQIKRVPAGTTIGYNRTFRCVRPTRIGILPVGYWDGLHRSLSNAGSFTVAGKTLFIRGRVCMNLTMVEVPASRTITLRSPVTLIGPSNPVEQLARAAGTIPYEVLTNINPLIPRVVEK